MFDSQEILAAVVRHWPIWVVTAVLVVAAVIDGIQLKVPNWITFPMIIAGWVYSFSYFGWAGLGWSLLATVVGLALLLPLYAIGGMGAGDVKLLAGIGAWVWTVHTLYSFAWTAVFGGIIAVLMVWYRKAWEKHSTQFFAIINEVVTIKNPETLATIAAERKPRMFLLPYGIPMAIGTIFYFAMSGMLL